MRRQSWKEILGTTSLGLAVLALVLFSASFCIDYYGPFDRAHHNLMMYARWASLAAEPLALVSALISLRTRRGRIALYVVTATLVIGFLAVRFPLIFDQWRSVEAPRSRPHMQEPRHSDLTLEANAAALMIALGCVGIIMCSVAMMMSGRLPLGKKQETPDWRAECLGWAIISFVTPAFFLGSAWLIEWWGDPRSITFLRVSGNGGDMVALVALVLLMLALFALDIWLIRLGIRLAKERRIPVTKTKAISGDTVGLLGCLLVVLGAFLLVGGFCFSVLISIQPH